MILKVETISLPRSLDTARASSAASRTATALMLMCAHTVLDRENEWSSRRYLDVSRLGGTLEEAN